MGDAANAFDRDLHAILAEHAVDGEISYVAHSLLARVEARVHFVSVEPMLEPIDIGGGGVDWVIVGGESGPADARVTELAWVRSLRDQCRALGVAFFVKQLMERGRQIPFEEWPEDLRVRQYPIV
jgi:protein gp37